MQCEIRASVAVAGPHLQLTRKSIIYVNTIRASNLDEGGIVGFHSLGGQKGAGARHFLTRSTCDKTHNHIY